MASGSSTIASNNQSSSTLTDLVANSSLTATASEFVPNTANRNKSFKKTKCQKNLASGSRNTLKGGAGEPPCSEVDSTSNRQFRNGKYRNRRGNSSEPEGQNPIEGDSNPVAPSNIANEGPPSRSSARFAGGSSGGQRGNFRSRKEWQNSNNYAAERGDEQGAVGGEEVKTVFFKNNVPGFNKMKDRNGNRDQFSDQPQYNDRPKYRDSKTQGGNKSQKKDVNAGNDKESDGDPGQEQYLDQPYYKDRPQYKDGRNQGGKRSQKKDLNAGFDKETDRHFGPEQYHDQPYYNDKQKFKEGRDQGGNKLLQKDKNAGYEKEQDRGRERSKYWDRNSHVDRDVAHHSNDVQRDPRYPDRNADRGQDYYQDRYYSNRPNRRYGDRYSDRRDDQNFDRNYSYYDREDMSNERKYSSRGGRFQYDTGNDEHNRQRNSSYQKGRSLAHNFNTQETFSSEGMKYQPNDSRPQHKEGFGYSRRGNEYGLSFSGRNERNFNIKDGDDVSQRDRLTEQLSRGTLECLVCCDRVRQQDSVWSCSNCYHVLHLKCVQKWAKSSKAETGWRCPACQNVTEVIPSRYRCFCGKVADPQWNRQDTPHTCGEVCGKSRESHRPLCTHRCSLLCHPGPCPPCVAQVTRNCGCGKTSHTVKCGLDKPLLCESVCNQVLNCGAHLCENNCHSGPCEPCQEKIEQVCFCKKQKREVECLPENQGILEFCCSGVCFQDLACGNHKCEDVCHEGKCKPCQLAPDIITHCPCGQTKLSSDPVEMRESCTDPIPTCGKVCGHKLSCGQPSNPHTCKSNCHVGVCPTCPLTTMVRCRCGNMDKELQCKQLTTKADDARCDKKCTKKRSCAKHKCNQQCCIEIDHPCPLPCNHTLSCGLHRCEQLCHRGRCHPCWRTSFEELFCECGSEVLYPPVPCGTKPPPCTRPCSREHDCEHQALHTCHCEPNCPPCTVLTQKYCYGNHELRKSIPCHQQEFSCGLPCNKELPCGRHKCIQTCHKGDCLRSGALCTQPCAALRPTCQHPCSSPCHEGSCPDIPCKQTVRVTCECGHRSAMRPCAENTKEYQRIATSLLASKMADVQLGHSIDIGDIMGNASSKKLYLKSLECNEECKIIERNRRMAIGLQIRNPDLSQKLTPRYSEFMRGWAKKDPAFCQHVHDKLTELVKRAKESKQKSRSYSFEVMNREKRQFVHEYCEHFGCESVAYDQEPKRNVVATADKAKAWLPSVGLLELVQREAGQRKVPGPMLNSVKKPVLRSMDTLSSKWSTIPFANGSASSNTTQSPSPTSNAWRTNMPSMPPSSNQLCDESGAGSSTTSSFIDHFNS